MYDAKFLEGLARRSHRLAERQAVRLLRSITKRRRPMPANRPPARATAVQRILVLAHIAAKRSEPKSFRPARP